MIPIWPQYFGDAHSLLYVIDPTDVGSLATAAQELQQALAHAEMKVACHAMFSVDCYHAICLAVVQPTNLNKTQSNLHALCSFDCCLSMHDSDCPSRCLYPLVCQAQLSAHHQQSYQRE